ncbi:hypothetical protein A6R68_12868 [Neotoma lepida]|uniref:Uncharacterized protein n=1 Tax=Neotoma lepida TaxID=56216 RepID=A0A1A6H1T9_NEOLE|nr:hypothetical protein A6R68_12868 [Neotoma lepida]
MDPVGSVGCHQLRVACNYSEKGTKLPAPILPKLLGFVPASQVAAGTQMKGPSESYLWQNAQPRLGSFEPRCPSSILAAKGTKLPFNWLGKLLKEELASH